MNARAESYEALREMLRLTKDEELDCDRFVELMAPYLDERVSAPGVRALIEHHVALCAECAEELATLERALGR
jgi:hypothetical protein